MEFTQKTTKSLELCLPVFALRRPPSCLWLSRHHAWCTGHGSLKAGSRMCWTLAGLFWWQPPLLRLCLLSLLCVFGFRNYGNFTETHRTFAKIIEVCVSNL